MPSSGLFSGIFSLPDMFLSGFFSTKQENTSLLNKLLKHVNMLIYTEAWPGNWVHRGYARVHGAT